MEYLGRTIDFPNANGVPSYMRKKIEQDSILLPQVAWMDPRKKVLSIGDLRIINDARISVERPYTRDWNLHIRSVRKNDSGEYQCQVNTRPAKSKKLFLFVQEPPVVLKDAGDQEVTEGQTVTLWCNVYGTPPPSVTWYRRYFHQEHMAKEEIGETGDQLNIYNVSRYCEDVYECVADNGINPPASRKMKVTVQFQPEVELPTKRIFQAREKETILDCQIESNPFGTLVWQKGGKELTNNGKYGIQIYEDDRYRKTLSLRINNLDDRDFGKYKCLATNELGSDFDEMLLVELVTRITTTTTMRSWKKPTPLITSPYDRTNNKNNQYNIHWDSQVEEYEQDIVGNAAVSRDGAKSVSASETVLLTTLLITVLLVMSDRR